MSWYDVKDFLTFMSVILGLLIVVFGTVTGTVTILDSYSCRTYAEVTGRETRHEFIAGCFVQTDSGWQAWEEYKARAIASEGLKK